MKEKDFESNLTHFIRHIDSIHDTLPLTMMLFGSFAIQADKALTDFLEEKTEKVIDKDGKPGIAIKPSDLKIFDALESNAAISALASKVIPSSLFVSLISQYDAFLNRLLRYLFELKPEILNGSDRNLTFSQLVEMSSISDAREYIIEKEVETVLRKSHSEQFDYLENKFKLNLRTNLPIWKSFIEITERRNLLVHCDGVVSSQYLSVCAQNDIESKSKVGQELKVSIEYFKSAYLTLYEICSKLTHTLWRKFLPEKLEDADDSLNTICYNLLISKSFKIADILLDFACKQKAHFDDQSKSIFIINAALSKYLQNDDESALKCLNQKDWSSTGYTFKLAVSIISKKYDESFVLMRKIGADGEVKQSFYQEWPLFTKIREQEEFKSIYKELFNDDYKVIEIPQRPIFDLMSQVKKKKQISTTNVIENNPETGKMVEKKIRKKKTD
ncbi:hypothetical protein [Pedobacter suwonensis]|uniref:hypothetical protein n=1 Tax=Pedobacter suwonensis TaxID=332999 RepID=UPI0036A9992B